MAYVKKRRMRKVRKTGLVKKAIKTARRKVFRNAVTKIVKGLAEKKMVREQQSLTSVAGLGYYNSDASCWGLDKGIFIISPYQNRLNIPQGDGQGDRVGNSVRTVNSYIWGALYTQPYDIGYNPTPRPMDVMLYIVQRKGQGDTAMTTLSGFYQNNSTSQAPSSGQIDTLLPINRDQYTVYYKRMFKLGFADNTGTGVDGTYQRYTNNDYKRTCRFRINVTKYLRKIYKYSDTATTPSCNALYMIIMPVNSDTTIPASGNNLRPIGLIYNQQYTFVDF